MLLVLRRAIAGRRRVGLAHVFAVLRVPVIMRSREVVSAHGASSASERQRQKDNPTAREAATPHDCRRP